MCVTVGLGLALAVAAAAEAEAVAFTPPPGTPDLTKMIVQRSDLTSAGAPTWEGWNTAGGILTYGRQYGVSTLDGVRLVAVFSYMSLGENVDQATSVFANAAAALRSHSNARAFVRIHLDPRNRFRLKIAVGRLRRLGVGSAAIVFTASVRGYQIPLSVVTVALRVGRAFGLVMAVALPEQPGTVAATDRLGADVASHVNAELLPINTAAPSVTGAATEGQTLTATPGQWTDSPTSLGYQWSRCDAAGQDCAPIAGATQQTYSPQPADSGSVVEVTVIATGDDGPSAPVTSAPSAVIS
jgi:hypothetical protein